jgi:penicillin-binding protein 2
MKTHKDPFYWARCLFFLLIGILVVRLLVLQVIHYANFHQAALDNHQQTQILYPKRGLIFDRHGTALAVPQNSHQIWLKPNHPDTQQTLQTLINLKVLAKPPVIKGSFPTLLKKHLSNQDVQVIGEHQHQLNALHFETSSSRLYPYGDIFAHALGYVTDPTNQTDAPRYDGVNGIEAYYNDSLSGVPGKHITSINAKGQLQQSLSIQPPQSGHNIKLTLDTHLQTTSHQAMSDLTGAVIVLNPNNGQVLALVSQPTFNPNLLVSGIDHQAFDQLAKADRRPLFNRAIQGLFPPASTLKPMIALQGLETGVITPDTQFDDPGYFRLPNHQHRFRCWKEAGHGLVDVAKSIVVSCDTFYYELGYRLGIHRLNSMLSAFGLNQTPHIDLPYAKSGHLNSPVWKADKKFEPWYPGDTILSTIGQGHTLSTPLQIAMATAQLATKGHTYQPHLLLATEQAEGNWQPYQPVPLAPINIQDKHWQLVHQAMADVIVSRAPTGTGWRFGQAPYTVAGKTGTAQVVSREQLADSQKRSHFDHSWFMAFAPVKNPQVVIVVLVEHGHQAISIARKILDAYFDHT